MPTLVGGDTNSFFLLIQAIDRSGWFEDGVREGAGLQIHQLTSIEYSEN